MYHVSIKFPKAQNIFIVYTENMMNFHTFKKKFKIFFNILLKHKYILQLSSNQL